MSTLLESFNAWSEHYDSDIWSVYFKRVYSLILLELKKINIENYYILDIGCGTGSMEELILKEFKFVRIIANDISPKMILKAKMKINDQRVAFVEKDVQNLELTKGSLDIILILNNLHHFSNLEPFLTKVEYWLKDKGQIIIVDPVSDGLLRKSWTFLLKNFLIREKGVNYHTLRRIENVLKNNHFKLVTQKSIMYFSKLAIFSKYDA